MRSDTLPEWLQSLNLTLVGFEDPPEDEEEEEEETEEEEEEEEEEPVSKKDHDAAVQKVKDALKKERVKAKDALKRAKDAEAKLPKPPKEGEKPPDGKDAEASEELDEARKQTAAEQAKSEKLAARLATNEVNAAVIKALASEPIKKAKIQFQDPDDVLSLIDRSEIDFEQDEDDPSDIEVDVDSVVKALKDLAKRKKHLLLQSETDDDEGKQRSGSKFNGKRKEDKTPEQKLKEKYPALARR